MPLLAMRHDFRTPEWAPTSMQEIYATALEQFQWADGHNFTSLVLSEHHGFHDGWLPAPITLAGIVLARTKRSRATVSASLLPLHDPVRIAEQIAVIDNTAPGRLWVIFGAGYRVEEFEMAGVEHADRGRILEEYIQVVLDALTGEPFEWRGRKVQVTPKPLSDPRSLLLAGGGVPAAARRAARLRLPMFPMNANPKVAEAYYDEAKKVGYEGGFVIAPEGPTFVHIADDPERAWDEMGPYVLYEAQTYASIQTVGQTSAPKVDAQSVEDLKRSPQYLVATPDDAIARIRELSPMAALVFNPLCGGMPPEIGWSSLELFAQKVLPHIT
jgi:alkanesulfonate monooxygenase SsuD/methylene tetrahydromethanopterin reductase-like flavin-dependent oxidoreductase (luciferase family)